jgi:RNase adaptor protein for sRNA GlmZ degradation|tara:strand:+ start:184 stop:633 length:450 start_codon:yes stop_codon:yes gene_type:complete
MAGNDAHRLIEGLREQRTRYELIAEISGKQRALLEANNLDELLEQIEKKKALMAEVDKVKKETSDLITRWPDIRKETAAEEIKQVEEEVNATRTLLEKIIRIENEDRGMFETEKNARSSSIKDLQNRKKLRQMYGGKEGGDSRFLDDKK